MKHRGPRYPMPCFSPQCRAHRYLSDHDSDQCNHLPVKWQIWAGYSCQACGRQWPCARVADRFPILVPDDHTSIIC